MALEWVMIFGDGEDEFDILSSFHEEKNISLFYRLIILKFHCSLFTPSLEALCRLNVIST